MMRVFISWSGERSNRVAVFLKDWLKSVLPGVEVWLSTDIRVGRLWFDDIIKNLSKTDFFVACLTPENLTSPWMMFEAGSLATRPGEGATCAYMIDMQPGDLSRHPLAHYHHAQATEEGTWKLVQGINAARQQEAIGEEFLKKTFEKWWNDLDVVLKTIPIESLRSKQGIDFQIINQKHNLYLEVAGDHVHNGATIQLGDWTGAPGQRWRFREAERGFFRITACHSDKCVDVSERRAAAWAKVHQWEYKGGDNQQWAISKEGDHHRMAARHSGFFLDCAQDLTAVQSDKEKRGSQLWTLLPLA